MLTVERLYEVLTYDPETGVFKWKITRANSAIKGRVAGCFRNGEGSYRQILIDGRKYYEHRLAWLYVHGEWPPMVDHINLNKSDNAIKNLRKATVSQNLANSKVWKNNKLGVKGVRKRNGRDDLYEARLCFRGKQRVLGLFTSAEEAHTAYLDAAKQHYGEFARGKK